MLIGIVRIILQVIGLATVVWFVVIAYEEYMKIRRREEREENRYE